MSTTAGAPPTSATACSLSSAAAAAARALFERVAVTLGTYGVADAAYDSVCEQTPMGEGGQLDSHTQMLLAKVASVASASDHNRYSNIIPLDSHLAPCSAGYVNATLFDLHAEEDQAEAKDDQGKEPPKLPLPAPDVHYIAAQGPMHPSWYGPDTTGHFWRCAWENHVCAVVSLAVPQRGFSGCADYFSSAPYHFGDLSIEQLGKPAAVPSADTTVRTLRLTCQGESREVRHFQFASWSNYGTPDQIHKLASLVLELDKALENQGRQPTVLVHCSGGIGRSGSFVALHSVWRQLRQWVLQEQEKADNKRVAGPDVLKLIETRVLTLRTQRHPWMVEGGHQFQVILSALVQIGVSFADAAATAREEP